MRVRFKADFNWHVPALNGSSNVKYKRGMELTLPRDAADAAVRAGVAEEVIVPARKARADK